MEAVEKAFLNSKANISLYKEILLKIKSIDIKGKGPKKISEEIDCPIYYIITLIKLGEIKLQYRYSEDGKRRCSTCNLFLNIENFGKYSRSKDGLRLSCKKCKQMSCPNSLQNLKEWDIANKINKPERDRKYRINNIDKIKLQKKTDKAKESKRMSDKKYTDNCNKIPSLLLKARLRSNISSAVSKGVKNGKTFDILGYTPQDLKNYLESKFTDGMTWDNYGRNGWHIDHIKPLVLFNINSNEDIAEAWSLNNLQPLWEYDNCSKSSFYNGIRYTRKSLSL